MLPCPGAAQSLTGSISGTVRNESGAALPGVTVTLSSHTTEATRMSAGDGAYAFRALEPGTYEVTAALAGAQQARRTGLVISPGRLLTIDLVMRGSPETRRIGDVAIDVKNSGTETSLSETLLASTPISRDTVDLPNYAPGITGHSAYGSESGTGHALLRDGVDTRNPANGTAGPTATLSIIEGVHVQGLGAPATFGGFTGAVVHTITRSGSQRLSGMVDALVTFDSLGSTNVPIDVAKANPALAVPIQTSKALDLSGHVGGRTFRDKGFFFASAQRFLIDTDPAGPIATLHRATPRLNAKFTLRPTVNDTLVGQMQYESTGATGRVPAGSPLIATDALTSRDRARSSVWLGEWRRTYGATTFSEVRYSGWTGSFDETPEVNQSGRYDEKGVRSVSQGTFKSANRRRQHVTATLSHYAQRFGRHDFKFGAEFERSGTRDRYGYVDNLRFYDYGGRPYLAYSYSYDVSATSLRPSAFAQDAWSLGNRVTANVGVRGDMLRGKSDQGGTVYRSQDWAPRLGVAWDVTGSHRTVLKGSYGWYTEGAETSAFRRAVPGIGDRVTYLVRQNSTLGPEILRERAIVYGVASNLKPPRVEELTAGFERVIPGNMHLAVTGIRRETSNVVGAVAPLARWAPVTTTNALAGAPITLYRWVNRSSSESNYLIQNVAGFEYKDPTGRVIGAADPRRTYRALMAVLTKPLTNRWEARVSYLYAESSGTVDNAAGAHIATRQFETPNLALVNVDGTLTNDRTHEFKLLANYQIPIVDVSIGAVARVVTGRTYTPFQRVPNVLLNTVGLPNAYREPLIAPRGSRRLGSERILDLRFEKRFRLRNENRFGLYVDLMNVTNAATVLDVVTQYPGTAVLTPRGPVSVPFETPETLVLPRQIWIGGRWNF